MGPPLVFTALLAVGLLGDDVAVRIDLVAVPVAREARRGDVELAGLVLNCDDGCGDRRGELAARVIFDRELDAIDDHDADTRHVEGTSTGVGCHRRRSGVYSVFPRPNLIARPVLVGAPEVESGGDSLGFGEVSGHGLLRRDHGGSFPHGLVPRGTKHVEGNSVRGGRTVEDPDLDFRGNPIGDRDRFAGAASNLVVDHHVAILGHAEEACGHDEFGFGSRIDRAAVLDAAAIVPVFGDVGAGDDRDEEKEHVNLRRVLPPRTVS